MDGYHGGFDGGFGREGVVVARGREVPTGDGEAECARVGGEETFEDGGFSGAGGAGDDDWTADERYWGGVRD